MSLRHAESKVCWLQQEVSCAGGLKPPGPTLRPTAQY